MTNEYITAKMALLAYGYKFGELMRLSDQGLIRRRHRVCDGEDFYTFSRDDIVTFANEANGDGNA